MMHAYRQHKSLASGFTLVEMLIYIAILVSLSVAAVSLMFTLRSLVDVYRADQHLTKSAQAVLERALYDIRSADMIDSTDPSVVLTDTPGHLTLIAGATTTELYLDGGRVHLTVNGVALGPLTKESVVVDELRFIPYDNGVTEAVRVRLRLTATVGESTATGVFTGAAVLRGTYD